MALTDEEKRTARAYNIGYLLSTYEPKLLDKIIKSAPKNEFVKAMRIGRDHREFHIGIPRKDYTPEFKNGFYNGRTLAEHDPKMIDRLIITKNLGTDYKKGLESAQKEYSIKSIEQKIDKEPKAPAPDLKTDETFKRGFNVGYRLADEYGSALTHATSMNEKYSKFISGIKAGREQYDYDLSVLRERNPNGKIFPDDLQNSKYESAVIEDKLSAINDISTDQLRVIERQKGFENMPVPKWLQKDRFKKQELDKTKDSNKDRDIDLDK